MFEWDAAKAATNLAKHGVSFEEAATVFADAAALDGADIKHSASEPRFYLVGQPSAGRVLSVAYTVRSVAHGEAIRLITARRASRTERRAYEGTAPH